ncbi:MAG: hypothetical protein L0312_01935 [Acidobacteria bacterium]|nr:hypothetical protein [Acidobacteriota bacterium]
MKASLEFDLNETDDATRHMQCVKAQDALLALWKIQELLREREGTDGEVFLCILDEYNLNLEELLP